MVPSVMQVPAYGLYVLWGTVQPFLGSILGSGPKVHIYDNLMSVSLHCQSWQKATNRIDSAMSAGLYADTPAFVITPHISWPKEEQVPEACVCTGGGAGGDTS